MSQIELRFQSTVVRAAAKAKRKAVNPALLCRGSYERLLMVFVIQSVPPHRPGENRKSLTPKDVKQGNQYPIARIRSERLASGYFTCRIERSGLGGGNTDGGSAWRVRQAGDSMGDLGRPSARAEVRISVSVKRRETPAWLRWLRLQSFPIAGFWSSGRNSGCEVLRQYPWPGMTDGVPRFPHEPADVHEHVVAVRTVVQYLRLAQRAWWN